MHAFNRSEVQRIQLEAAAARVFKGRFQIGQFDPSGPNLPWDSLTGDAVYSKANQKIALEGAQQSPVLLRNPASAGKAHLPLKKGLKIAIIGPNGDVPDVFQGQVSSRLGRQSLKSLRLTFNSLSLSAISACICLYLLGQYHGGSCPDDSPDHDNPPKPYSPTYDYDCLPSAYSEIAKANAASGGTTTFHSGCSLSPSASDGSGHPEGQPCTSLVNMSAVTAAAKEADVVILALGLDIKMTNKEGQDRNHNWTGYALPGMHSQTDVLLHDVTAAFLPDESCVVNMPTSESVQESSRISHAQLQL